jgi:hypothetical protein
MPADLADHAAATTAGYKRIQIDRGSGVNPRYFSRYEKPTIGQPGAPGGLFIAEGSSNVDQATADAQALAALNGQRKHRYAGTGGLGGSMTADVN